MLAYSLLGASLQGFYGKRKEKIFPLLKEAGCHLSNIADIAKKTPSLLDLFSLAIIEIIHILADCHRHDAITELYGTLLSASSSDFAIPDFFTSMNFPRALLTTTTLVYQSDWFSCVQTWREAT